MYGRVLADCPAQIGCQIHTLTNVLREPLLHSLTKKHDKHACSHNPIGGDEKKPSQREALNLQGDEGLS